MILLAEIKKLTNRTAVESHLRQKYGGEAGRFVDELNQTVNHLLQDDLREAARFVNASKSCFRYLPAGLRPRLTAMEARLWHWSGQSGKAVSKYRMAIAQMEKNGDYFLAAVTRQGLMDAYMYLGRHEEALAEGQKALRYFHRHGKRQNEARVLTNLGNVYHRLDDNHQALKHYNRAYEIFKDSGGFALALVNFNRANVHANLGQLAVAERLYREAGEVYRQNNMALASAKALYSLAYLYFLQDRFTEALETFDKVLELFQRHGDLRMAAVTRLDLAEINIHLNQFGSSILAAREIIPHFRKTGLRYEQGKAYYFAAVAYQALGDRKMAASNLARAGQLFAREGNLLWQGMVRLARSGMFLAQGRSALAVREASAARKLFLKSGDQRRSVEADLELMAAMFAGGQERKAVSLYQKLRNNGLLGYQKFELEALRGRYHLHKGHHRKALGYLRRAMAELEKALPGLESDELRYFYAIGRQEVFLAAAECFLRQGKIRESFLQHSRFLQLLNAPIIPKTRLNREVPRKYLEQRTRLRAMLRDQMRPSDPSGRAIAADEKISSTEQKLWGVERRIRTFLYASAGGFRLSPESGEDWAQYLKSEEMLIDFVPVGDRFSAFCVNGGRYRHVPLSVSTAALETTIRELHFLMEKSVYSTRAEHELGGAIAEYLDRLSEDLLKPLQIPADVRTLFLLVDGLAAQIPFAALPVADGQLLKDRFDLRLIINPDDLCKVGQSEKIGRDEYSAIFAPSSAELPLASEEGIRIKGVFEGAQLYIGAEAVGAKLKEELDRASGFIHLAAHAARSSENPLFSRILMNDGPFFPFDLYGLGIRARLVTLSGCQTAAPGIYYGNSFSLARAFYQAGARYVLASLWPVSDKISMVFMTAFYKALGDSCGIVEAYHEAINATMAINQNPAFWSPFILLGI